MSTISCAFDVCLKSLQKVYHDRNSLEQSGDEKGKLSDRPGYSFNVLKF